MNAVTLLSERPQSCRQPWAPRARPSEALPDKGMQRGFGRTGVVMMGFQNLDLKKKKKKSLQRRIRKTFCIVEDGVFLILTANRYHS